MITKTKNKNLKELYGAVLQLETADECKKFFRDLCTISELAAMTERFQAVKMINEGIPYREISKKTGSSTATITRVAHWLHHGKGGYKLVLERLT
ncbi:hypothetical protein JKY72_03510 [Candidatus Gracilibacteria bacterium]|nr:hypothetical protein [Candidatus Gracilibacteria bacterium]